MVGKKWHIVSASGSEIVLYPGRQKEFLRPIKWGSFPGDRLLDIYELYFPEPTPEQYLAMSYLCEERDMTGRAQRYLQAAPADR
jgi:hypothetical protein